MMNTLRRLDQQFQMISLDSTSKSKTNLELGSGHEAVKVRGDSPRFTDKVLFHLDY
jgi:hypothetical protein